MAVEIGALRALLSLNTAAFEKGAKRADASMGQMQKRLKKVGQRFDRMGKDLTKKVSLPLVAMASVAVKSSLSVVDAQSKMAQSLGTSTRSMQVLDRAADRAGVSTGQLEQVAMQLTKRLSQAAAGGGPAAKSLDRLGLSADALAGMDLDERIAAINGAIAANIPVTEQAAVAATIFGDRAGIVASRLDAGTIKAASDEITRFGVAVTEVDADKIEEANDAMSALGLVTRGLSNQMAVALAPVLKSIAEKIADVAGWFSQLSPETKRFAAISATVAAAVGPAAIAIGFVATGLAAIASPIALAVAGIATLAGAGIYLANKWGGVGAVVAGVKEAWSRFAAGISEYIAPSLESLKGAWDNIKGALANLADTFGTLFGLFGGGEAASSLSGLENLNNLLGKLAGIALRGIAESLELFARGLETATGVIAAAVKGDWSGVLTELEEFGDWFKDTATMERIRTFGRSVADVTEKMADKMAAALVRASKSDFVRDLDDDLGGALTVIGDLAVKLVEAIKQMAVDLYEAALQIGSDIIAGIRQGIENKWSDLKTYLSELTELLPDFMRKGWRIQSPSRVFAEIGQFAVDGLIVGFDERSKAAIDRAVKLGRDVANATKDAAEPIFRTIADGLARGDIGSIGSGLLSQAQTAFSGKLQNVFAGAQSFGSIFTDAISGVGSAISGIGSGAAGAAGGIMSGIGGALSAAMPAIGAVTAGIGLVKSAIGTTTKLTNAIEGTFDMTGLIGGGEYDLKENDGWFGGGTEKNFEAWEGSWAEDIGRHADKVMKRISKQVSDSISELGLEVQNVVHKFDFQFKEGSLPDGHLYQVVAAEAAKAGEAMLKASLEAAGLSRQGETGAQTLSALNAALTSVNGYFDTLGWTLEDISAKGAGAARSFSDLFGGIDGMDSALSAYHETVYTQKERMEEVGRQLSGMFSGLGIEALPETRAQIRGIVDGLMEVGNRDVAARIIQITPALTQYIDHMNAQAEAAANAAGGAAWLSARLQEVSAEISTRFAAGMDYIVQNFYSTAQQLEFYSSKASAAFQAAGIKMPETADAFRAAAQKAASDVQQILDMVAQGKASLAELEAAKQKQLAIIELADEAKKVYDLQDQAARERLEAAERAAREAAERAARAERARQQAVAQASRQVTTTVSRTVSALDQMREKLGDAIADIGKMGSEASSMSRIAAARIVALAAQTGKAWEQSFAPAVEVLKKIDASDYASRMDFDRARAEAGNLLASARDGLQSYETTPMTAREQREYHNEATRLMGDVRDVLNRLYTLERQRGIA